jgi:hypothetical protein
LIDVWLVLSPLTTLCTLQCSAIRNIWGFRIHYYSFRIRILPFIQFYFTNYILSLWKDLQKCHKFLLNNDSCYEKFEYFGSCHLVKGRIRIRKFRYQLRRPNNFHDVSDP